MLDYRYSMIEYGLTYSMNERLAKLMHLRFMILFQVLLRLAVGQVGSSNRGPSRL